MLHVNHEPRILQHAGISSLEPVIPPANRLIAPLDLWAGNRLIRVVMIPWAR